MEGKGILRNVRMLPEEERVEHEVLTCVACVCVWPVLFVSTVVNRCCGECVKRRAFISFGE